MLMSTTDPLVAPPPQEVPLTRAPLVRVLAQVRFPPIPGIGNRDSIGSFQKQIRDTFPVVRPGKTLAFVVSPFGMMQDSTEPVWRFLDLSGDWRVSLAPDFLALETTKYTSRSDFFEKFRIVLGALAHLDPQVIDRIGIRYIDRVVGLELSDIAKLVKPEVLGVGGLPFASASLQSLSETLFAIQDAQLLARWGKLPANATVDPNALEPIGEPSWILDLDMFSSFPPRPFKMEEILSEARSYSEKLYGMFRWVVTDEFLKRYGGTE